MRLPDYQHSSLVNLMSRLALEFGADDQLYPAYRHNALEEMASYEHIVLLIIDGLGARYVDKQLGFLKAHKRAELTSVFPTTTASSITTFMTGQAPQQHGLTGWYTYLKEVGAVTAVLPCQIRGSRESLADRGIDVAALYGHTPFFDQLTVQSTVVAPEWIIESPFNVAHSGRAQRKAYTDLESMFQSLHGLLYHAIDRQYIYAYWPDFDRLSHQYGNNSEQVAYHYRELDLMLERFYDAIAGTRTLLLITADHGFIDTTPERLIKIDDHPHLQDCLSLPLSGEPRVAYCYVHPHKADTFVDYVQENFGECMDLYASQDLIAQGAFGLGQPHPQLSQRVGDYTLIMKDNYVIKDWLLGEKPFFQLGVHGGVSELEMQVPLIVLSA